MNKSKVLFFIFLIMLQPCFALEELPYNYLSTERVPIYLTITKAISTKDRLQEGGIIEFKVLKNVYYNDSKVLSRGDIVPARIETIITSGMNGFPAEIIVDDFVVPGIEDSKLMSTYTKVGQNRCYWVYPLKWSLTLIPFVGSLTNFIKGGHAKIKTTDVVTLYYYPKWK